MLKTSGKQKLLPIQTMRADEQTLDKLRVIEAAQGTNDFLVSIHTETPADKPQLESIKTALDKGNYTSYFDTGVEGNTVLRARYVGRETTIEDAFSKLGALGGFKNAADKLSYVASEAADVVNKTFDKPIKFLSGFYMAADVLNMMAGQHQAARTNAMIGNDAPSPKFRYDLSQRGLNNISGDLYSSVGAFSMAQAAVFMRYGQDASVREMNHLSKAVNHAIQEGEDPYKLVLQAPDVKEHLNIVEKIDRYARKNPIDLGAGLWITGQLAQAASGGIRMWQTRNEQAKEGMDNIIRAAISIASWGMLLADEKHTEEKTPFMHNPVKRITEEIQEAPNRFASMSMIAASLWGIKASYADSNPYQRMAEISNITGDVALMFSGKSEYGEASEGNTVSAAKAAADFMKTAPMLFTASKETEFVNNLAHYMAERSVNDKLDYNGTMSAEENQMRLESIADMEKSLSRDILAELSGREKRMDKVANTIARISELFPEHLREAVQNTLCYEITQMECVYAQKQELLDAVQSEFNRFANRHETPLSPPKMSVVADTLAELTHHLPPIEAGYNAARIFDAVAEYVNPSPMQEQLFNSALDRQLAKQLGATRLEMQALAPDNAYAMAR